MDLSRISPRAALVALAVLLMTVAGCAEGTDRAGEAASPDRASVSTPPSSPDSSPPASPDPTGTPTGSAGGSAGSAGPVLLLSQVAGNEEVDPRAVVLDDDADVAEFVAPMGAAQAEQVRTALAQASPGPDQEVVAAVVFIGCATPQSSRVERSGEGWVFRTPVPKEEATTTCLVAHSSVAVAVVG